jgi:hypothetical protein
MTLDYFFFLPNFVVILYHSSGSFFCMKTTAFRIWGAIHQLLNIILQLRILVLLLVSALPYVVKVNNYS